ncbi:hypothetical protein RNN92_23090, partial [Escherichia coli]|nr:hypothetical protein [Escherichia coli]
THKVQNLRTCYTTKPVNTGMFMNFPWVEHPFRIIKRQFGFVKARYKGLLKNDNQLAMLFTLANLFRADQMIRQWERSH